jgi:two-component system sensor histidine kinase DesK
VSASPVLLVLLLVGQPRVRVWAGLLLVLVILAHTGVCLLLLRAGIAARLGGPRPAARLIGVAVTLTAVGLAAGPVALPAYGRLLGEDGLPVGLAVTTVFLGALTLAVTPLLAAGWLVAAVALPTLAAAAALGEALSRHAGLPYERLIAERVTDPLHLPDTHPHSPFARLR